MPARDARPKAPPAEYKAIAAQFARAKRLKELEEAQKRDNSASSGKARDKEAEKQRLALEARRKAAYGSRFNWTLSFWVWMLCIHVVGIYLFTSGFLLARLVLDEQSECATPPVEPLSKWNGQGTVEGGCWHPKTFDKAVVVVIDALKYDFTVPVEDSKAEVYHNAFPFLYETSKKSPNNAVLLPFIADPPTATLQRLKGLTTGTLPTFIDIGSSFGGTAIEEDNILKQLRGLGKNIAHLGDDTWTALFPGYFEPNISRAYDSFNVWDLHTVDNGVLEHIFPLLQSDKKGEWDVLIGHLLGVDHAGHRYGPSHAAMTAKLQQMDKFVQDLVKNIDDDTLLVVMGDHGMDGKGDHGGESDDEVEAALWMYSKRPVFGRTKPEYVTPPATAKIRPVNQIDLVPTLSLLLGIPIPFNNLGRPIEEAFAGRKGNSWDNLAAVTRLASAGIKRYQASYFAARGIEQSTQAGSPAELWETASASSQKGNKVAEATYTAFVQFQEETLRLCKDLWARFDVPRMITGIAVMALGVVALLVYVSKDDDDEFAVVDDMELDFAEKSLELMNEQDGSTTPSYESLEKSLIKSGALGVLLGTGSGLSYVLITGSQDWPIAAAGAACGSIVAVIISLFGFGKSIANILPTTFWGWLSVIFTASQSIGFAANSYTIWEDSISLFFLSTFGLASAVAALRRPTIVERSLGIYHSVIFVLLGRLASFSKLCREEQMPYCTSTYYASANSSTPASWQLIVPYAVLLILPTVVKGYMMPSRSFEGLAPVWVNIVFRGSLFLAAAYWSLDAANNAQWFPIITEETFKTSQVLVAQTALAIAFVAGTTAFIWAPPCVSISTTAASNARRAQVTVLGYGNANGARYLLLVLNFAGAVILLSKPMGAGALALMLWQILSLIEIVDLNALTSETIGPITLALLGNFHYFKTGHQAALSSLQWDSAFIPLKTVRYPWSPIVVALNTYAGQILACVAVPLLVLWKTNPKRRAVLESTTRALGVFVAYYAVESLATMAWAGHLRRHLMLYRVFSPRFMMAASLLVVVDLVGIAVTLTGVRTNTLAISEVFGWAE